MRATANRVTETLPAGQADLAGQSSRLLAACIGHGETARLRIIDGNESEITVPVSALRLLVHILDQMAEGHPVSVVPHNAMLTTQEAANLLGVSRPYLVGLLDRNEIPSEKVGRHRRVMFRDLETYRRVRGEKSRKAREALTAEAEDLDLEF